MKKLYCFVILLLCMVLNTGCFGTQILRNAVGGLEYDYPDEGKKREQNEKTHENQLAEGSRMKTKHFKLEVNSAVLTDYYDYEYPPDEDWRYLVVNLTLENTYKDAAVLWIDNSKLQLGWKDLGEYTVAPEDRFSEQLSDETGRIKIFRKGERNGNIIYEIPKDIKEFELVFSEYEDGVYETYRLPVKAEEEQYWDDGYEGYYDWWENGGDGGYDDYYGWWDDYGSSYSGYYERMQDIPQDIIIESEDKIEAPEFLLTVNSAKLVDAYEKDVPKEQNQRFLVVNVTIENTEKGVAGSAFDLCDWDFQITWKQLDGYLQYPVEDIYEDQLPEYYSVSKDEPVTGNLIYTVSSKGTEYVILYSDSNHAYKMSITPEEGEASGIE